MSPELLQQISYVLAGSGLIGIGAVIADGLLGWWGDR